jgi:Peptidase family S41/N-terminal domain of Peptidase_S41 in eukaryotic IRBP
LVFRGRATRISLAADDREADMDQAEAARLEQLINREITGRFPLGSVRRATLVRDADDPALAPDELLVRVLVDTSGQSSADPQQLLDDWARANETGMRRLRRELSLRLPPARLLEFTVEEVPSDGTAVPRITMPDDPALTAEPLPAAEVVDIVAGLITSGYVFPDRAARAAAALRASLAAGEYDGLDDEALAETLTSQLYETCRDKHLRVRALPPWDGPRGPHGPGGRRAGPPGQADARPWPAWLERGSPHNYGIAKVERLEGNVGYLDLHGVAHPDEGGLAIAAAMELVSGTGALIIDLRHNGGGAPAGVVFWLSYLFPDDHTHLNDIFDADSGETRQFWTLASVPGQRYLDRPVLLLTSERTFSGGEDFAYSLQAQGRAELIGETTGGGAHPTRGMPISATLAISLPHARSINPVTGTNWEGTGVTPDVAVPAEQAFGVAYGKALRHVLTLTLPPPLLDEAREALAALEA